MHLLRHAALISAFAKCTIKEKIHALVVVEMIFKRYRRV